MKLSKWKHLLTLGPFVGLAMIPVAASTSAYAQEAPAPIVLEAGDGEAARFAAATVEVVSRLANFCTYEQYGQSLLPIKKAALKLYISAHVYGDLSKQVHEDAVAMEKSMDDAEGFIDQMLDGESRVRTSPRGRSALDIPRR